MESKQSNLRDRGNKTELQHEHKLVIIYVCIYKDDRP